MVDNLTQTSITLLAGEDLSDWQNHFVRISGVFVVKTKSARGDIHGVLLDKPDAKDKHAEICIHGICKLVTDGTIEAGDYLMSDTSGRGDALVPGDGTALDTGGWALQADGGAGSKIDIFFNRMPTEL